MNVDLEHLVELQAQDLELKRLRDELGDAPRRVLAAQAAHTAAETRLRAVQAGLAHEEALGRRQESDAEDHRTKLTRLRRQLAAATSAAQVTALEHEISFGEAAVRKLDDNQMESLERSEALESEQVQAAQGLEKVRAQLAAERTHAGERTRHHQAAIADLQAERAGVRAKIAEALLANYDRVAKARGTGLAEAIEGQCTACRMKVRPQRWHDLAGRDHEEETFTCESCGRILFFDPRRNTPGPWVAGDRLAAALHRTPPALAEARA